MDQRPRSALYDFGDSWVHDIKLIGVHSIKEAFKRRLLDGARACPPEDCGSVPGYEELVRFVQTGEYHDPDVDESDRIEGKSGLGDAAMKSITAFSNEVGMRGGWIVFGVRRQPDGTYETQGVKDADQLQTDLATRCRGVFNRQVDAVVRADLVDGKRVVVAFVPEAAPGDKPIYIKKQGLPKGAYRRIGSADCVLTDADLGRLASLAQVVPFDRRAVPRSSRTDIDPSALSAYRQQLKAGRPGSELLLMTDDELLHAVGAWDGEQLTYAGLALFGSTVALRRLWPSLRVDVITTESTEISDSYQVVEVREALVTGWRRVYQAVADTLPKRVTLTNDSLQRTESLQIPELALREAIVNALIHRDLEVASPIQVRRFPDRIEIDNPGYSLVDEEDWDRVRSMARNATVAQAFTELDLAETRGTGMRRMRSRMSTAGLRPPQMRNDRERNWFTLTLPLAPDPTSTGQVAGQVAGQAAGQVTPQVRALLGALEGEMSRSQLQDALGLAGRSNFLDGYLQPALDAGLVEMTLPDKPRSRLQRYRLTAAGRAVTSETD